MSSPDPGIVIIWTDSVRPPSAHSGVTSQRPRTRNWAKLAQRAVLLGVPLAYLAVLLIGPLLAVLRGAFAEGVGTFFAAVTSANALHAFLMTLAMSVLAIVLNTVFGVAIAWTICRDRFFGRSLLGGLVDLPFAVSPVVVGLMAMLLFGRHGWFGPWLKDTGINVLFSWPAIALVTTFVSLPCVVREVTPVLEDIGLGEEEAAARLGPHGYKLSCAWCCRTFAGASPTASRSRRRAPWVVRRRPARERRPGGKDRDGDAPHLPRARGAA